MITYWISTTGRHSSPVETVRYLRVQKEQMLSHQMEQMEVIYGNVQL